MASDEGGGVTGATAVAIVVGTPREELYYFLGSVCSVVVYAFGHRDVVRSLPLCVTEFDDENDDGGGTVLFGAELRSSKMPPLFTFEILLAHAWHHLLGSSMHFSLARRGKS